MSAVSLFTAGGTLVTNVQLPRLPVTPAVIEWRGRYFYLKAGAYVEGVVYHVNEQALRAG